ncbi:MAG: squalene synthase HpnC [Bacteroidota bacterium]
MAKPLQLLAETHYENFPVASFILSKEFKGPIRLVYAFARVADDIADEGKDSKETRLQRLSEWEGEFVKALAGEISIPFFQELAETVVKYSIPQSLFFDLIAAFQMDCIGREYNTFEDLLFYCRHSANPVGRILLHIFSCANDKTCSLSDAICTSLQLTNFWQDLSIDIKRNRVYIPREDFERFGLTAGDLRSGSGTDNVRLLLKFQVERTKKLFLDGKSLFGLIDKRFAFDLRLTYHGGVRILEKIESDDYSVLHHRPALSKYDWALIGIRSFIAR